MLKVDETKLQPVIKKALKTIGTAAVRNLATLGGNICAEGQKLTLWAPLVALDSRVEIKKSANDSKVIPL
ncbi:MAG: FAD binding domain-containing protein, partial [Treponema sp.]|nr:FAD binding domain-containing protein [Treponema sp.]